MTTRKEPHRSETRRGFHTSLGRGNPCTLDKKIRCGTEFTLSTRRVPVRTPKAEWRDYLAVTLGQRRLARYVRHASSSFLSLLKRGILGTYHSVSKKYLPLYLAEFSFLFNNPHNPDNFGSAIAGC
jgi:hypothetical protein